MPDNTLNPVVGIDLGTTFSAIARWADDRPEHYRLADGNDSLPSVVYIQEGGKPLVGKYARQKLIIDPENAVAKAKRFMGDDGKKFFLRGKEYSPVDISALILERIADDIKKKFPSTSGFEFAGAIVTHPQYFKYPQIARTQQAAEQAGLPVIRLLSEPVAAALDYGFTQYQRMDKEVSEKILVFDLGGGTFDVTVLHVINDLQRTTFRVLSVGGDDMLGGTNFDEKLAEWALKESGIDLDTVTDKAARDRSRAKLLEKAIEVKCGLSAMEDELMAVPSILPDKHMDLEVTREQFNEILKPYCDRIRRIVSSTIASANLRAGELDRTIMIGGSSRIPIMREIVREETGAEPWADADPDLAVCRGAAFLAAMEDGRVETNKEIVVEEATSHALGIRAAGDKFAVLIPANRPAPVEATKIFTTHSEGFTVTPYQGTGKKVTDDGVIELMPINVSGVQLDGSGQADVKITFKVNDQQMLFVKIEAPGVYEEGQVEVKQ
jgi:molecular chaperone DnaK